MRQRSMLYKGWAEVITGGRRGAGDATRPFQLVTARVARQRLRRRARRTDVPKLVTGT